MAHIQRRSDRSGYIARWRTPTGAEQSRSFRRKSDAESFLTTLEADKIRGSYIDPRLGRTAFQEWALRWESGRVHVRPSTAPRDASLLRRHVLPALGGFPLGAITKADLQAWVAGLVAQGLSSDTVRKAWMIARAVLVTAADSSVIGTAPVRGIKLPKLEHKEPDFFTIQQVETVANTIDERYRVLVLTAAYTGLRWGELAGLQRDDLNLLRRQLTVRRTLSEVSGAVTTGSPKTRAARRTIGLPGFLADELAAHLAGHDASLVFAAPTGGPLRASNWRNRFWYPATRSAGLGDPDFHALRHTHVALLIAQGENGKTIAERLGHTDVRTVLNVYGHLFEGLDQAAADRLDEARANAHAGPVRDTAAGDVIPFERP